MISSITTPTLASLRKRPPAEPERSEFPFDLSVLDTAREFYFLPHMDRLAGHLVSESGGPLRVRVEAENQSIEYTLTADPTAAVVADLNGQPYLLSAAPAEDGSLDLKGTSGAGDFDGNYYLIEGGAQVTGLGGPNRMPVNHSLWKNANPQEGQAVLEASGSFGCARMHNDYFAEGQNLHLYGNLGVHDLDAVLSPTDRGWILQGDFGDMKFRQTFTRVSE